MSHVPIVESLLAGKDLNSEQARDLMAAMLSDDVSDSVKGAALGLLRRKGATGQELAAFAQVLRDHAITIESSVKNLVDTCGTGGGIPSFNLSTAAALIATGAGATVAKHGNRAVTSSCGSADVLEALGVRILDDPDRLSEVLEAVGIAFLFAPGHHPTMKKVGPIRRELGFKTVFNQLGPLAYPFGARRQVVGVYQADLVRPMAEALALLGAEHALTVHGMDGLDEISPCGATLCAEVISGEVREFELVPADFGLEALPASALACGNSHEEGAAIASRGDLGCGVASCLGMFTKRGGRAGGGGCCPELERRGRNWLGSRFLPERRWRSWWLWWRRRRIEANNPWVLQCRAGTVMRLRRVLSVVG